MESSFCSMQWTVIGLGIHELGPIPISPPCSLIKANDVENRIKTETRWEKKKIMHFSISKKNITQIGFCLYLYFITFRY